MNEQRFADMVARLEQESIAAPGAYRFKVALLALLGFGILALILLVAGFGILLLAGLAIATVLTGGKAIILLLKFGKLLVLLAVPLWLLLKSSLSALFTRFPAPQGRELSRTDAPALFEAIDRMRARMQGPPFHHVLVTHEMNAAVVQRPLLGLCGWPRNYLILGLPLLESLTPDEALAVVAHEYGHLAGSHARFGAFIYRLRNTWGSIQDLAAQWQGWGGRLLRRLVEWYAPYFNAYTFVLARANEYEADAASAELVSPAVAANALKRVNIAGAKYEQFFDGVFRGLRDAAQPPANTAQLWSRDATRMPEPGLATRWLNESLSREKSAFDTHPVLRDRLRALPGEAAATDRLPAPLEGRSAADAWLGESADPLRQHIQAEWAEQMQSWWRQRHDALQVQVRRLAELRAQATSTTEQQVERLQLAAMLEPEVDALAEIAAFNVAHPDQTATLLLEGRLRLERDDETGLAALDRAIDLDAEAVKPGCEIAHDWLLRRGAKERARAYADRWQARHEFEVRRSEEVQSFDHRHELRAPDLDAATLEAVRTLLDANRQGIRRVWLARRVLPSDDSVRTYVLCIQLTAWARFRSQGAAVVERLANLEWPMHCFLVPLDGEHKRLKGRVESLPGSLVLGEA